MSGSNDSAPQSNDPFYVVQQELKSNVSAINAKTARFEELLNTVDTATSTEFRDLRKALGREVRGADSRLKDLKLTVDYVERDRATFQHIDDAELESRRAFIASTRDALAAVKASVNGDKTRRKMEADERKQFAAQSDGDTLGATSATSLENTRFVRDQKTKQQMMLREQDDNLEELDGAVDRVHHMAVEIQGELKDQSKMLDDLETDLDATSERMQFVMGKLQKLLKTKDSCQIWTIVILTLVLVGLVALVIYW